MLRRLARLVRDHGALAAVKAMNRVLRKLSAGGHRLQMAMEWAIAPPPEWFDHFIDVHYQWKARRVPLFLERGVFSLLAVKPGARILELCCGDGFNAHHFYSIRAASVSSVDFDRAAIAHARRNFDAPNVTYEVADVRTQMPAGTYDNVIWDAAIEHFTEEEIGALMVAIRERLGARGILSGYTVIEDSFEHHPDHEYEFKSKQDLARFLAPHFANVLVLETGYPSRKNLYFFASDAELPFDASWADGLRVSKASP
jgi:protein-L-isoaspartate O-methyltransferase